MSRGIDEEKSRKSRPDLVPALAIEAAGDAFAYGVAKHGIPNGRGTYRIAGTEQAETQTHVASFERHWLAWKRGEECDPESGLSHLAHAMAQLAIVVDLVRNPPNSCIGGGSYLDVLEREAALTTSGEGCP